MPPAVTIMTFATLADIDRCFDFQTDTSATVAIFKNKVRVSLIVIVLVGRVFIHRVAKNVRNKPGEIIALNQGLKRLTNFQSHVAINAMNDRLRKICGSFDMRNSKPFW